MRLHGPLDLGFPTVIAPVPEGVGSLPALIGRCYPGDSIAAGCSGRLDFIDFAYSPGLAAEMPGPIVAVTVAGLPGVMP